MGEAVAAGPAVAETEGDPWVQQTEHELQNLIVEHAAQEAVSCGHGTQTVSMTQAEPPAADFSDVRLDQPLHPELLEI